MERYQPQPPKETRMFRSVPMQHIADLLRTLPLPITITQQLDTRTETLFYTYQVGIPTEENPVGISMGATTDFLRAVRLSLEAVMTRQTEQLTGTRSQSQEPSPIQDEWRVPEVERGEATSEHSAALGLPYRHRVTGETIAQWAERYRQWQRDTLSEAEEEAERQEQAFIQMLRNLPVALNIWKREDGYVWQCYEQSGRTPDFTESVGEGLHSLVGQLMHDQEVKRRGRYREFGAIFYQTETEDGLFMERIVTETDGRRVVMCSLNGVIKLYRIEWTEPDGWQTNKAVYTLRDAMDAYQAIVPPSQQGEV